jgi:hypothetical protein
MVVVRRSVAICLVFIAVIAVFCGTWWWAALVQRQDRETFADNNVILNAAGGLAVDDSCIIQLPDNMTYNMSGYMYLGRHPSRPNACVFQQNDYDSIMDSALSGCKNDGASFLFEQGVVESVHVDDVGGVRSCVVAFKPGASADAYDAYAQRVRDATMERTKVYKVLKAKYDIEAEKLRKLQDEVAELRKKLEDWQRRRRQLAVDRAAIDKEKADATESFQRKSAELRATQDSVRSRQALIVTLNEQLKDALDDVMKATKEALDAQTARDQASGKVTTAANEAAAAAARRCKVAMWADQGVYNLGPRDMAPWGVTPSIPDPNARWIWSTAEADKSAPTGTPVVFQTQVINVAGESYAATLFVVADNTADVYLNDLKLGTAAGGWSAEGKAARYDVQIPPGISVITLIAINVESPYPTNPAGIIATLIDRRNDQPVMHTDHGWKCSSVVQVPKCG